ncbi:class D sortase [Brevibacillus nitrificans]|uniref:Class D sortase n=1 Tax=Brevibacillus nitrificans TaxID=651560 RepID=A0A3M8DKF4_9BACL|nr:class D sortase [Brevibacillus nitrificans]RNB87587.1 class D sortase [Brevibacillus nitrificans]
MRLLGGFGCILIGLLLLFSPQLEKKASDQKQEQLIEAFEVLSDVSQKIDDSTEQNEQVIVQNETLKLLDGARGVIRIPKIDLSMMIFEGSGEASLRKGVGMIEPEKEFGKNNVGIAGHRATTYGKQFNRLNELVSNDTIEIQTKDGSYEYVIVNTFIVDRTKVEVLADHKEPLLTLVTCTPIGKKNPTDRLIVQAKLISHD